MPRAWWTSTTACTSSRSSRPPISPSVSNFSEYLSDTLIDADADINLTDEQIEVVQQLAIWHFTNGYNVTANILYKNGYELDGLGNRYDVGNFGVYFVNEGEIIAWKMEALYNYFIEEALDNFSLENPTLDLLDTDVEITEKSRADPIILAVNTESITDTNIKAKTRYKIHPAQGKNFAQGACFFEKNHEKLRFVGSVLLNKKGHHADVPINLP